MKEEGSYFVKKEGLTNNEFKLKLEYADIQPMNGEKCGVETKNI